MSDLIEVTKIFDGESSQYTGEIGIIVLATTDKDKEGIHLMGSLEGSHREDYTDEDLTVALSAILTQTVCTVLARLPEIENGSDVIKYMSGITELVLDQLTTKGDEV